MPEQYPTLPPLQGGNLWTTPGNRTPSYSYAGYAGGTQLPLISEMPPTMAHEKFNAQDASGAQNWGPEEYAWATGIAGAAQVAAQEVARQQRNAQIDAYRRNVQQEARGAAASQLEDIRKQKQRQDTQARLASAKVNREYLQRRAAAAVNAGATGVAGTTAEQVVATEEIRQARALASIETELRLNKEAMAEQERAVAIQERQRLLQANGMRGAPSTVGPDLAMVGLQAYTTYLNLQGAQKAGIAGAIEATS